jgi:hypothetical protein
MASNEQQLDIYGVIIANIIEIQKRADERHEQVMAMFEQLDKTLEAICTQKPCS